MDMFKKRGESLCDTTGRDSHNNCRRPMTIPFVPLRKLRIRLLSEPDHLPEKLLHYVHRDMLRLRLKRSID